MKSKQTISLNSSLGIILAGHQVKKWEEEGYGFKFVFFEEKSSKGWWCVGYRMLKGKRLQNENPD